MAICDEVMTALLPSFQSILCSKLTVIVRIV